MRCCCRHRNCSAPFVTQTISSKEFSRSLLDSSSRPWPLRWKYCFYRSAGSDITLLHHSRKSPTRSEKATTTTNKRRREKRSDLKSTIACDSGWRTNTRRAGFLWENFSFATSFSFSGYAAFFCRDRYFVDFQCAAL